MIQQTAHFLLLVVASAPVDGHSFEDVSREYRIETYDTFRQQRPEFDRRQQLGIEASRRWKEAKFDTKLRNQIVEWFVESTDATQQGVNLPELPGEPSLASQREAAREAEARANELASSAAAKSKSPAEPAMRKTSIVTKDRLVETNQGRNTGESDTVKILSSVGRAMTHALINRHAHGEVTPSVTLEERDIKNDGLSNEDDNESAEAELETFDGEI